MRSDPAPDRVLSGITKKDSAWMMGTDTAGDNSKAGQRAAKPLKRSVRIPSGDVELHGDLVVPAGAPGIVVFAHGTGSSRHSPRNKFVAERIQRENLGTLLFDLLTVEEEREDMMSGRLRFDIRLLARRLACATAWVRNFETTKHLGIGYFGSSTGGAAAIVAGAGHTSSIQAIVSRGGRPDLAAEALARLAAPTLFIVGKKDQHVLQLNHEAFAQLNCPKELVTVPLATHLFEEPGTLEKVADLAAEWFARHLTAVT